MPIIVLTAGSDFIEYGPEIAGRMLALQRAGNRRLAALSTIGDARPVRGSGHVIQADRPAVVVAAIRKAVARVRGK